MTEPVPQDSQTPNSRRATLVALAVVLLLVFGGLFLVRALRHMAQIQDCAISGRSNCTPIDTSPSGN